ncbi:TetR/AcrR family transcriptional regulator [Streptomyces sp. NPDC048638]|uniref:TetR/AcrR family transcriptional regulator n=1 Tax=Streptomyces sp. NPDC048638 TaxID=3365580 RepID=UPI0037104BD9
MAASGADLASIGYHHGSQDALMSGGHRLQRGTGRGVGELPAVAESADPLERFAGAWGQVLRRIGSEREFIAAQVEVLGLLPCAAGLREALAEVLPEGGEGLVARFEGVPDTEVGAAAARVVGSFYQALLTGLTVRSLVQPEAMPSGRDPAEALRRVMAGEALGPEPGDARPT